MRRRDFFRSVTAVVAAVLIDTNTLLGSMRQSSEDILHRYVLHHFMEMLREELVFGKYSEAGQFYGGSVVRWHCATD